MLSLQREVSGSRIFSPSRSPCLGEGTGTGKKCSCTEALMNHAAPAQPEA
jgi:hypothetical protein